HLQVWAVSAAALGAAGAPGRRGPAALVSWVSADLLGTGGVVGAGQLVRPGRAPLRARSLAAWAAVSAAHGGTSPLVAGAAGALATVAAAERAPTGAGAVWVECQHGAAVAQPGGGGRAAHGAGAARRGADLRAAGDGRAVGAAAREHHAGGTAAHRQCERGGVAAGGGDRGTRAGAVAAAVRAGARRRAGRDGPMGGDQRRRHGPGGLSAPALELGAPPALCVSSVAQPGRRTGGAQGR